MSKLLIFIILIHFYSCYSIQVIDKNKFVKNPKIIIIDVSDTLISINRTKIARYFGFWNLLKNNLFDNQSNNIQDFYLEFLSRIPSNFPEPNYSVKGINEKSMPPLQRDFLLGKLSSKDAIEVGNKWLEKNKYQFKNDSQLNFFKKIFYLNFDFNVLASHLEYTPIINLLKELYNSCDNHGKRKNICILLSNESKEIIPLLERQFYEIFRYSDQQIFSCNEGFIKPHPKLFEKCFSYCPDLSFKTCFFIDDEIHNREAAKKLKIKDFSIISSNPNEARRVLAKFEII